MDVSVRELKNHLSEYLRRVRAGEELHITLRGKRIARLLSEPITDDPEEEALRRLEAQPAVFPPADGGKVAGSPHPFSWPEDEKPLSEFIAEDRG